MQIRSRDFLKSKKIYFVIWEHLSYFLKMWCSFHDFNASRHIFSSLGKGKIVKKNLLKRKSLLSGDTVGGLGTSRRIRLFPKSMKYLTTAKHSLFAVVIRTFPIPVQLKPSLCKLFPFLIIFPGFLAV